MVAKADKLGRSPDPIINEAQRRFNRCLKIEGNARNRFLDDYKFANGDYYNGYQWPNSLRKNRDIDDRPCLTINKVRQHNLQIINNAKQNKPSIKFRAVGGGATYQAAQIWNGIGRHIEYISTAQMAYDQATSFQVQGGIGWLRLVTDYADEETFDQELFIEGVRDPLTVFLDPDAKRPDKSDARFGFVFQDYDRDEFQDQWPEYANYGTQNILAGDAGWYSENNVRIAEYYRQIQVEDKLVGMAQPDGTYVTALASQLGKDLLKEAIGMQHTRTRPMHRVEVEYVLIIGNEVAKRSKWPGKYIPLIPVIGEETYIEGVVDRKGHTRAMLDPQRMYNYWTSSAVEQVALQGKSPYIASAESVEGFEVYWNTANKQNYSALFFNAYDDNGNQLPPPIRAQPPEMAQAYVMGMKIAQDEVMSASGQYQAQLGEQGNERSGKAINERQRQGDNATYHYIDNLAMALRYLGRQILDIVPNLYDTNRIIKIIADDESEIDLQIDPMAKQAYVTREMQTGEATSHILNPKIGKYWVEADMGPAYGTRREEAFTALVQIITQAPQLTSIVGDILLRSADFPAADEAAQRLKRMVPPQALGQGPSPQEQQLQQMVNQLKQALSTTVNENAALNLKLKGKEVAREVSIYEALTKRLDVMLKYDAITHDQYLASMQLIHDMQSVEVGPVGDKMEADISAQGQPQGQLQGPPQGNALAGPPPGAIGQPPGMASGGYVNGDQMELPLPPPSSARQAPDGNWYVGDPRRLGKYMRVLPSG